MAGVRITLACCCAAWGLASLGVASNVGIGLGALLFIAYGAVILLVIWLTMMVAGKVAKKRAPRPWFEPVGVLVVLAMIYADVPFRARFFISKPFLDRYVREAAAPGWTHGTHERVGLFTARETEVLETGLVRIVTTSCMFDHCGLVFSSKGAPPVIGEDRYRRITSNWWRWSRSW
jgi:hypothetical protein